MMRKKQTLLCAFTMMLLLAVTCLMATLPVAAQQGSTVQYVYDENGRVRAVIAPSGETTVYTYDVMGNLISVTRQATPLVSISGFTPTFGILGTTVTIMGSGFNTTANQNTVTFNGTAASVTSASNTQIVTNVPTGATTGPITISNSNGTATSRAAFTVRPAVEITSFTPTIGAAGTQVTLVGQGFDETNLANNEVKFNGFDGEVDSADTTQLVATVSPGATSGHISVTTPSGTAVSSEDFFVPPPPYTPDYVGTTGRLQFGQSKNIQADYGQIALFVFDGTIGQRLSLNVSDLAVFGTLTLYRPNGTQKYFNYTFPPESFWDLPTLDATGTYTLMYVPWGTTSATFTLYQATELSGTITPGGSPVTVTNTAPGQNVRLSFNGTAGQKVSLGVTNATVPAIIEVDDPSGGYVDSAYVYTGEEGFMDTMTLAETGTYSVLFDPQGADIGSQTLRLYNVVDLAGTIESNGPPVTLNFVTPGQNARLAFSGTPGQSLIINFSDNQIQSGGVSVYNPDGSLLLSRTPVGGGGLGEEVAGAAQKKTARSVLSTGGGSSVVQLPELQMSGTYTMLLDPDGPSTGAMTLNLMRIEDVVSTLTIGGPPVTITTTIEGQKARISFDGTAGQRAFLRFSNLTINYSQLSVRLPDGSTLVDGVYAYAYGGGAAIDINNLPVTGTYTILINPLYSSTGSMTVSASLTGSMEIDGPTVTEVFATAGQAASLTFEGVEGQVVTLQSEIIGEPVATIQKKPDDPSLNRAQPPANPAQAKQAPSASGATKSPSGAMSVSSSPFFGGVVSIFNPDGTLLFTGYLGGYMYAQSLPATGTYRIEVTLNNGELGEARLRLSTGGGGSGVF